MTKSSADRVVEAAVKWVKFLDSEPHTKNEWIESDRKLRNAVLALLAEREKGKKAKRKAKQWSATPVQDKFARELKKAAKKLGTTPEEMWPSKPKKGGRSR